MERILVGIDGSAGAVAALSWAAELARATGATVRAAHVFQPPLLAVGLRVATVPAGVVDDALGSARETARSLLEGEWTEALRRDRITHDVAFLEGSPGRELVQEADGWPADVIVVGRRGHGELTDLILGSVGHHLIHHARRPVTIVPS